MKRQITLTLLPIGLVIFCLTFGHITTAAPGDLDPTFSGDGKLIDGISYGSDGTQAVAVQSDGKIVAAGGSEGGPDFALVRYNTDGSLDTSFGGDGKVTTDFGSDYGYAFSVAIQPDGKIVAAGYGYNGSNDDFALVRYNTDGSLDTSFDGDGKVTTNFGSGNDIAFSVAIQPDGKIVAAGYSGNGKGSSLDFALVRYNTDGSLDTSFDGDGKLITDFGSEPDAAWSVAIQQDGKIVAAGVSGDYPNHDFALVRYNTDGSLDTSFDGDGKVTTDFGGEIEDDARSIAIQSDGKIVAAGYIYNGSNHDFALVRYNTDGSLDASFDGDGKVTTNFGSGNDIAFSVAIQLDGKIVAAGESGGDFALVRYNPEGSLDTSFDGDGKVTTDYGSSDSAYSVTIQPDGKIVAAGSSYNGSTSYDFALVRYNTDGSFDPSFDGDGRVTTDFGIFADNHLNATAIQPDGKIVAVGTGLARYNPDGSPDTTFGNAGKVNRGGSAVAIQSDGKIVTTGENTLARYNPNGTPDIAFGNGSGSVVVDTGPSGASTAAAIQSDGKILVAGYFGFGCNDSENPNCPDLTHDFWLARYNTNGSVDTSFGSEGKVVTDVGVNSLDHDYANSVVIQTDGKIIVAGDGDSDFALVRYNPNGSLDTSFGGGGIVVTQIEGVEGASSLAIQPDGKIIAAGYSYSINGSTYGFALTRYNTTGSLDATFDDDGKVITPILGEGFDIATSVAIQPDGKIVAAGSASGSKYDFALARYNPNGSLDNTFSGDGISTVNFNNNSDDRANGMALDGQGRAVVVGQSDGAFAIARFILGPGAVVPKRASFDYDGDGKSDYSVWRPSNGTWFLALSQSGSMYVQQWGTASDKITPADYDGDGITDMAIYRPSEGKWYVIYSQSATINQITFGLNGDVPLPQDFDGDGRADFGIWRPSNGTWYLGLTESSSMYVLPFGLNGDKPVPADFDGDGKSELAVWRPSEGRWYVGNIATGAFGTYDWGLNGDMPVVGDFSGDRKADYSVYRPSNQTWYRVHTDTFSVVEKQFGVAGDIPAPGDFDGDGKLDIAVFRPSEGKWYVLTATNATLSQTFGLNGDVPTESAFVY